MRPDKATREKAMDISRPYTPRSERPRSTYGSLQMSVSRRGACGSERCVKRANHSGRCWPERS